MAFHWQTFRTRALTAILFVLVMGIGLFYNRWSFFVLFAVVHFGCWIEYFRLAERINGSENKLGTLQKAAFMLGGFCLMLYFSNNQLLLGDYSLTEIGWWCGLAFLLMIPFTLFINRGLALKNSAFGLLGLFYISLSIGLLLYLRTHWSEEKSSLSFTLPLLTIFSLWINDTMAYIVGSLIGRTPLSEISPKKTWEGTIGGILLSVIVMCLLTYVTARLSMAHTAAIAAIAGIAGTFGDLFESKLKRLAGVKDSGSFMPGHGGFLDRFDSLLFASIAVWIYAVIFL